MVDESDRDHYQEVTIQGVSTVDNRTRTNVQVNPVNHATIVEPVETTPLSPSKLNASYSIDYNAAGDVVTVRKIIGSTTYTKTISNTDTAVASTKVVSVWS